MRQKLVIGNWKMNGLSATNHSLVTAIVAGMAEVKSQVGICPSFVYLQQVNDLIKGTSIKLGAQNASANAQGAFTGEIAVDMLKDLGCYYVILGHSERRALYQESDEWVAQKVATTLKGDLIPVLCVGELLEEREANQTETVVARQLQAVINLVGIQAFEKIVVAYEPVWAIGTGKTATPEQAQAVHAFIRKLLSEHDAKIAQTVQILYGGSVKGSNAAELFAQPDIDGGLIGGAALKAEEFLTICKA